MKTQQAEKKELWIVQYMNHDMGSTGGYFVRKSEKEAERSAKLMRECGYQTVTVRQFN